jgi:hypothetical protein
MGDEAPACDSADQGDDENQALDEDADGDEDNGDEW